MFDTKLYVVRHAQGMGNKLAEFHGQYNSDLTELGKKQAECTAEYLKDVKFDGAYSSDIARAYSTACIIAKRHDGLEIVKNKLLREIDAGKWECMKFDDIEKNYPKEHEMFMKNLSEFVCPGGESVKQLHDRVKRGFDEIVKQNPGKTLLIASHATPIRCMLCDWKGLALSAITQLKWVSNASVTVVEYNSQTLETHLCETAYSEHLAKQGFVTELPSNI